MEKFKERMKAFGVELRKNRIRILIITLLIAFVTSILILYKEKGKYRQSIENNYNMAFYQLVDEIQNVEVYLAKSIISNSPESGAENLTYVWREANMAQLYLSMLPISSSELENTAKFLNQVSDYSYSLSRKTIDDKELSQGDLDNLDKLHEYSMNLKNILNQLSVDLNDGRITWAELTRDVSPAFAQQVSNISKDSFSSVEENFHEYAGLIYDGAFSEHMTNPERRGLTGEEIDENRAEEIVKEFCSDKEITKINRLGLTQNTNIEAFNFSMETKSNDMIWISISKKGGHIVSMNSNRSVNAEALSQEEIDKKVESYLNDKGFKNMKKTYFSKNNGVETINYAYEQEGIIMYPDLIKVKVAMDNGEVLGIETTGYLNSHTERAISEIKISKEDAIKKINSKLEVNSCRLAIIPTEYSSEIMCWEFKGKVKDREFLVYINVENGKEEDILVILNSSEGTLTM
ncbi:MAG: germination protein YpeB [Clostridia bacterium]|nr:germination protein YpeB [Clostridia bacterium]MBP3707597.1 germination protein YpeB [Clostridia bacterium]